MRTAVGPWPSRLVGVCVDKVRAFSLQIPASGFEDVAFRWKSDTWYEILFRVDLVTWRRARRESLQALSGRRINIGGYHAAAGPCQITDHGGTETV